MLAEFSDQAAQLLCLGKFHVRVENLDRKAGNTWIVLGAPKRSPDDVKRHLMAMRQANKRVAAPFQQRPVKLQHDYGPGPVAMSEKARNSHNHNNYQGKSHHLDQPS